MTLWDFINENPFWTIVIVLVVGHVITEIISAWRN